LPARALLPDALLELAIDRIKGGMAENSRPLSLEEKRARLARALERKARQPITAPLSFNQQRLWLVDQLDRGNPRENIVLAVRVSGPLPEEVLRRMCETIAMRHESLRTTFALEGGQPVQRIAARADTSIESFEPGRFAGPDNDEKITQFVREEGHTRFDLSKGPLVRVSLLRLAPEEHVVCCATHHIISDGWSVGVVLYELVALYGQFVGRQSIPLPELPIQYRDYARWQRETLQGAELQRLLDFWKRRLEGAPHTLELPTDRPRPNRVTYNGAIHRFRLPGPLLESLKELGRREGATLFMTLLAGLAAVLFRYSGQEDMLIGVHISGRERAETQHLIGFFANLLVVRVELAEDPAFCQLLDRVRRWTLDAYAHQDLPFDLLVKALQPRRASDRLPLVQVLFNYQNYPVPSRDAGSGSRLERLETHSGFSRFELSLQTDQDERGGACLFEYNTDLFSDDTIQRLARHFRALLESVAADADLRLSQIPLSNSLLK
jgi:hypothetical protein